MQSSRYLAGPTQLLVIIATLMLQFALFDRKEAVLNEWLQLGVALALAVIIATADRFRHTRVGRITTVVGLVAIILLQFVWEAVSNVVFHQGNPLEVELALFLRNMMIGLAARLNDTKSLKSASLASCFLVLCSMLWMTNRWNIALLSLYTIAGMWWLVRMHWARLRESIPVKSERVIPWKPASFAAILAFLLMLALFPLAAGENMTTAIRGFVPSSGGTRWHDEQALGGVGDGLQLVKARQDASGFAPIETELFLESKMPSLYDVVNEFSDTPPRLNKKKERQRAIPLAPSQMQQNHQKRGANQRAVREFSAVRQHKRETRKTAELRSHALLQVAGRVPVHLGLYTYDQWDGRTLRSSDSALPAELSLQPDVDDGKNWARYVGVVSDRLLTHRDQHEIRIINLKTDRVPAPPNTCGVHIDQLTTEGLFTPTRDGMLALDMDFIPQLSVLHVESLQRRRSQVPRLVRSPSSAADTSHAIMNTARRWTEGIDEGWPQVEAICARLQQECVLDSRFSVPPHTEDAVSHFLFDSKRGPDYLFACTTALLLRSLGYETRVVSGFYASAEHYDRASRLTSVYARDAHFWVEVLATSSDTEASGSEHSPTRWITVEPSPGYETLFAPETIWSQLGNFATLAWYAIQKNPLICLISVAFITVAWRKKADLCDIALTSWWRIHHRCGDVRHAVKSTLLLLHRRAIVRGKPRAKGVSLDNWRISEDEKLADQAGWEKRFVGIANWALYGEGHPAGYSTEEIRAACTEAAVHGMRRAHWQPLRKFSIFREQSQ